jgi:hypothetical protein
MMPISKLDQQELNRRAAEVFELQEDDYIYSIEQIDDRVYVNMSEVDEKGNTVIFDYIPDMTERPEALAYLMGERDNFDD